MDFCIDEAVLRKTFFNKKGFQNKVNEKIGIFPFALKTGEMVGSLDQAIGAFFRKVYDKKEPTVQEKENIIFQISQDIDFDNDKGREVLFQEMLKELYFEQQNIKCFHLKAYQQLKCSSREEAMAGYLLDVLTDKEVLREKLSPRDAEGNVLEQLILKHIPELAESRKDEVRFYCECPELKEWFMKDIVFLWESGCADKDIIVRMMELYFFTSVARTLIRIDKMFEEVRPEDEELYYCVKWETTTRNRQCYRHGWKEVEARVRNMACHALLLELLNQNDSGIQYDYRDIKKMYGNGSEEDQKQMYDSIMTLKKFYMTECITDYEFAERQVEEKQEYDIFIQLEDFLKIIKEQFDGTSRKRAKKAFAEIFLGFAYHTVLRNRYSMGYMLELTEEHVLLLAKLALHGREKIRCTDLFKEMRNRGIFVDDMTQEQIVRYFEKLNIIEKKSDSGDAQYVKGIL